MAESNNSRKAIVYEERDKNIKELECVGKLRRCRNCKMIVIFKFESGTSCCDKCGIKNYENDYIEEKPEIRQILDRISVEDLNKTWICNPCDIVNYTYRCEKCNVYRDLETELLEEFVFEDEQSIEGNVDVGNSDNKLSEITDEQYSSKDTKSRLKEPDSVKIEDSFVESFGIDKCDKEMRPKWSCKTCSYLNDKKNQFCGVCKNEGENNNDLNESSDEDFMDPCSICKSNSVNPRFDGTVCKDCLENISKQINSDIKCTNIVSQGSKSEYCTECLSRHKRCFRCATKLFVGGHFCVKCGLVYGVCEVCKSIYKTIKGCKWCKLSSNSLKKHCHGEYKCCKCGNKNLMYDKQCEKCSSERGLICYNCHHVNLTSASRKQCGNCGTRFNNECKICRSSIEMGMNNEYCGKCLRTSYKCRNCNDTYLFPGKLCIVCRKDKFVCSNKKCGAVNSDKNKICYICDEPCNLTSFQNVTKGVLNILI